MTRILLDVTAALKQTAGIGRYTRGLVDALATHYPDLSITLVATRDTPSPPAHWPYGLRRLPFTERQAVILWQRLRVPLPADLLLGPAALYHSPDFVLPPLFRVPGIVTVHDLSFLVYPQHAMPGLEFYLRGAVPRAVRRARLVLADSESTRRDLIRFWNTPPDKVRVLYPGISPRFRRVTDTEVLQAVRERYHLPDRFILSVSRLEPRKNFPTLIEAFNRLKERTALPHHLVIAGGKGWLYGAIFTAARRSPYREQIHFPGFVADTDLPALYSLADAFAYPSFYEGFGFPPLEAMACGTPVLSADNSSLPEVVGEAGLLLPAEDPEAWAEALSRVLTDGELGERLRAAGPQQAAQFTWETSAEQLVAIYEETMAPTGGRGAGEQRSKGDGETREIRNPKSEIPNPKSQIRNPKFPVAPSPQHPGTPAPLHMLARQVLAVGTALAWAVAIWGSWVSAPAMALTVLGVDMAEVVKFLPAVRSGQVHIWREAFLFPQVTLSAFLAFHAWHREWHLATLWRLAIQVLGMVVALSMLPPAWSPATLRAPEWRLQMGFIALGLLVSVFSPLWGRASARLVSAILALWGTSGTAIILVQLARVWPHLRGVYNQHLVPGMGVWALGVATLGLWGVAITAWCQGGKGAAHHAGQRRGTSA